MSDCPKFAFIPDNIVPESNISGTQTVADYPLNNLKNFSHSHSARWSGQSPVVINFSFDVSLVDTVVINNIDISMNAKVKIRWTDINGEVYNSNRENPDGLTSGGIIPIGVFTVGLNSWLERDDNYTSNTIVDSAEPKIISGVQITIEDPTISSSGGNIDIGSVIIGKKRTFSTNYNWGFNFQQIEKTIVKNSSGTHLHGNRTALGRVIELPLNLDNIEANQLMELEKQHHDKAWWFDAMPWNNKLTDKFQIVGLVDNIKYTGQSYDDWSQQITIKEV